MITVFFNNVTRLDSILLNPFGEIRSQKRTLFYPKEIRLAFYDYIQNFIYRFLQTYSIPRNLYNDYQY